ncbi:UNVERIFIED_CONTAM: hypothetical protein FKN15_048941 [Acipenser sinensis]
MGTRSVQTALSLALILLVQLHGAFGWNWPDQQVYNPVLFTAPRAVFQAKPTPLSVQRVDLSLLNSVTLDCRKDAMVVTVNRDLFGIGYLVSSADLSVGSAGCLATSSDSVASTVLFSIQLQDCGSTFQVFPDFLSYTNHLYYKPASVGIITRVNMADILLECRYPSCLMDSKSPDSSSSFTRPALNKLHFDITAFKFQGDSRSMIYMTCTLRAVNADKPADASNKACSYQKQSYRWVSEDGSSAVCGCCDAGSCSGTPRFLTGPLPPAEINQPNWNGKWLQKRAAPLDPAGQDPRVHVKEITIGPLTVVHVVRDHAVVLSKESLYHPLQFVEEVQGSSVPVLAVSAVALALSCAVLLAVFLKRGVSGSWREEKSAMTDATAADRGLHTSTDSSAAPQASTPRNVAGSNP